MRRKHVILAGLVGLTGAVGCNRQSTQPGTVNPTPPMFGAATNPKFDPTTIPQQPASPAAAVVRDMPSRKANAPLRADTEVALADNAVQDAFQEMYEQVSPQTAAANGGEVPLRPKYSKAEQDRMVDTARQRYQRALVTEPNHKGAMIGLARLYAFTGDKERAVQAYAAAVKAHPQDHGLACRLAGVQIQFGDFPAAEQSARLALSQDPQNRTYQKTLGLALGHQAKWQEAGEVLLNAGMAEADAHYFLARVRLDRGDAEGGRKQLQLALAANPKHEAAVQVAAQLDGGSPAPALPAANPVMTAGFNEGQR